MANEPSGRRCERRRRRPSARNRRGWSARRSSASSRRRKRNRTIVADRRARARGGRDRRCVVMLGRGRRRHATSATPSLGRRRCPTRTTLPGDHADGAAVVEQHRRRRNERLRALGLPAADEHDPAPPRPAVASTSTASPSTVPAEHRLLTADRGLLAAAHPRRRPAPCTSSPPIPTSSRCSGSSSTSGACTSRRRAWAMRAPRATASSRVFVDGQEYDGRPDAGAADRPGRGRDHVRHDGPAARTRCPTPSPSARRR